MILQFAIMSGLPGLVITSLCLTNVLSLSLNSLVLKTFFEMRSSMTFKDYLLVGMAIGDLLQSCLGYPLEIFSSYNGHWKLEVALCKATGFLVTTLGLVSIFYLAVIAGDLYVTVCKPFLAETVHDDGRYIFWTNFFPWTFSLIWGIAPLIGWSSYTLEADRLRCSINWAGKSVADYTYICFLFVFCYLIPLVFFSSCFIAVKRELHEMHKRAAHLTGSQSTAIREEFKAEKRHTKLAIVMTTAYIVTWTPYALLSFWSSFFEEVAPVSVFLGTVTALIAKMSTITNPIIYTFLHARFRQNVKIPCYGRLFTSTGHSSTAASKNTVMSSRQRSSATVFPEYKA